jgi:Ig-like domain from next to BRCA1 gene
MKRLSIPLRLISVALTITFLVACGPGEQPGPSQEEIDAAINTSVAQTIEAQGAIATSVAMTVAAKEAEAAAAQPSLVPSPTLVPTLTPVLATATPFPTSTGSGGSGGGSGSGGGGGSTTYSFSCDIIRQRPIDNTEFHRTNTFDVSFAILNNGTSTWEAGKDLVLLGNPCGTLTSPPGTIELPKMEPGDVFSVGPFDAVAPDAPGHYVIDFKLEGGFCYPYVAFNVIQ